MVIQLAARGPRVFRAYRIQTMDDGSTTYFDAIFEYTGDTDAPFKAQGTHSAPATGRLLEHDSTWYSTCLRQTAPEATQWQYYEHANWWKVGRNLQIFVPAIPLISSFLGAADWRRATYDDEVIILVTSIDVPDGEEDEKVVYYTFVHQEARLIVREEIMRWHPVEKSTPLSDTYYDYGAHERPVVHQSKEDCLSRNAPSPTGTVTPSPTPTTTPSPTPTATPPPDTYVSVSLDAPSVPAGGGEELRIDFTVKNQGHEPASGVTVTFGVKEPSSFVMARSARGTCEGAICNLGSFDGLESVTGHVVVLAEFGFDTEVTIHADASWLGRNSDRSHSSAQTKAPLAENQPGALMWTTLTDAFTMSCGDSIVVGEDAAYTALGDKLYALSKSSGEVLWRRDEDSSMSQPVLADGNIYVTTRNREAGGHDVRSLDASTGSLNWQQNVGGGIRRPVEVYGGSVYLTVNHWVDGRVAYSTLLSLDALTGVPNWEYRVDKSISTIPVVFDDNVYFGTYSSGDDYLYAIEPRSGELIRQYEVSGGYATPLIADGNAFIVSGRGSLYSIDLETGTRTWEFWPEGSRATGTPILVGGIVYFRIFDERVGGGEYPSVYALDAATGNLKWVYTPGPWIEQRKAYEWVKQPTAFNESIYVPTSFKLVSLDGLTGSKNWQAGYGRTCGPLTAADGVLYGRASSDNGFIIFAIRIR